MSQSDWPLALLIVALGPVVGSFLGVLVERLPQGLAITKRSHCASCGRALRWCDMIPVISVVLRRGACRSCGAGIPGHLIRIELAAALVGVVAVSLGVGQAEMVLTAMFLWTLLALFYCDLLYFRLPDPLTAALFVLGMGLAINDPAQGFAEGLMSAGLAFGAFLLIRWAYALLRRREGLGLGDVKVMAGIGAAVGWAGVPLVTLIAALLALAVIAIDTLRGTVPKGDAPVPFGSYLCVATAFVLVM